jgi:predicted amidohydrolase
MKNKGILILINCLFIFLLSCDNNLIEPFGSFFWQTPPKYDDSGATRTLNVAAVSFNVDISPEVNRQRMLVFIDKIKAEKPDVRLILFPETMLGYYYRPSNSYEYQRSVAETIPGVTTNAIRLKAMEHNIYISFGMVEMSENYIFNSQVLIGPDGTILSVHHKNHLTPWDIESGFKAGNGIALNIIDNIKVATIICYDSASLNVNRKIHESGAELVLVSFANVTSLVNNLWPFQFINTWVLGTNRVGREDGINYDGLMFLTAPSGERRIRTIGNEGYIYGVVRCR